MSLPNYLTTFVHEVGDLLEHIEAAILALESTPGDRELINQLFRAFHTLKGSAGVAGVNAIVGFTHHVETAIDQVRSGAAELTPPLVSAVLAAKDHVAALLAAELDGSTVDRSLGDEIIARLDALAGKAARPPRSTDAPSAGAASADAELRSLDVDYLVTFVPGPDPAALAALDIEPTALIAELSALGSCSVLAAPTLDADRDGRVPEWQFVVTTNRGENAIHDVFIFVTSAGELQIDRGLSTFVDEAPAAAAEPASSTATAAAPEASVPGARRPPAAAPSGSTLRVSTSRLDRLVKLIGEMVITQSALQQSYSMHPTPDLAAPVESFERLIGELRDSVLSLRMVPIGTLFTRFHRLIRDLSAELDKDVDLMTVGDETELDKTVIDQLGDALVHILRNSMDHGLESPQERAAAGKPRVGRLRIGAAYDGAHVIVTVSDDGRGIDLAKVRRKAEALGLIAPGDVLSERDTIALVTRPGFSTAASITQLSGRGVGMDVVKRIVEGLRGTLAITSRAGVGTEIRLALPLTLAIIDGLLVEIDRDRFIVPLAAVTENLELTAADRRAHNGRNVVALRGELVPYVRLREVFQLGGATRDLEKVVVVTVDGQRVGLVVDRVIGSHQTVIQPLGRFFHGVDVFSGSTIMGDGRVAMILDLASTVRVMDSAPDAVSHLRPEAFS